MLVNKIRQATTNDIQDIKRVWEECVESENVKTTDNILTEQTVLNLFENQVLSQNDNHKIWLYVNNEDKALAYCAVLPFQPSPNRYFKWGVLSLFVDKDHQNHTLGYLLLKFALDYTKTTTIKYIFSTIALENIRVKRLAEKTGWNFMGKLPHNILDNDLPEAEIIIFES